MFAKQYNALVILAAFLLLACVSLEGVEAASGECDV